MSLANLIEFLSSTAYFEDVPREDIAGMAVAFEIMIVPAGTRLFEAGDPGDAWFLIIDGEVEISGQRADGSDLSFATLEAGDAFGEIALLDDDTRSARATVASDATLARLPRTAFLGLLAARQPGAVVMIQAIATRLSQRLRELTWIIQHYSATSLGNLNQRAIQTFLKTMLMEH